MPRATIAGHPRTLGILVAVAVGLTALPATAVAVAAIPPPGVFVSVGARQPLPYHTTIRPRVDERYLPMGCDGKLMTSFYDDSPRPPRARVRMGCGPKWGTLPAQAVMRDHAAALDACRLDAEQPQITEQPAITGVKFVIGRDGSVGHVTARADDAAVAACLERAVERLTFPRPEGGPVTVAYPLRPRT
jgi:hypothetical protein